MITVCFAWDVAQVDPLLEWRVWRQLRGAFAVDRLVAFPISDEIEAAQINVEQYATAQEALDTCQGTKVVLDPAGDPYVELPAGDLTIVVGSTLQDLSDCTGDCRVMLPTSSPVDLYGFNAAAVMLWEASLR